MPTSNRARVAEVMGLRGARINPGHDAVRALGAVAVVASLLSGVVAWRARPSIELPHAPTSVGSTPMTGHAAVPPPGEPL